MMKMKSQNRTDGFAKGMGWFVFLALLGMAMLIVLAKINQENIETTQNENTTNALPVVVVPPSESKENIYPDYPQ
jgi:hypothetical protein